MQKFSSKIINIIPVVAITIITVIVIVTIIVTFYINQNNVDSNRITNAKENNNLNILNEKVTTDQTVKNQDIDESIDKENGNEDSDENNQKTSEDENIASDNNQEINNTPNYNKEENNPNIAKPENISEEQNNSEPDEEEEEEVFNPSTSDLLAEANQLKSQYSALIQTILQYTNEYRQEANDEEIDEESDRNKLTLDSSLTTAACVRAIEIARGNEFSHTRPNGTSCFTVLTDMGISSYARAENIAECYSAESAATGWKNSPGHYKNMINKNFKKIGIGVIKYNGTYTWVQLFTN